MLVVKVLEFTFVNVEFRYSALTSGTPAV